MSEETRQTVYLAGAAGAAALAGTALLLWDRTRDVAERAVIGALLMLALAIVVAPIVALILWVTP